MSSAAVYALLTHRAVLALLAFAVVYASLTVVERVWRSATRTTAAAATPRRARVVLSRTHELVGVVGAAALTLVAAGLVVAGA